MTKRKHFLEGKKFGRWNVIKRAPYKIYKTFKPGSTIQTTVKSKNPMWYCVCDCGTEKAVTQRSLLKGLSKSCGCLKRKIPVSPALEDTGIEY